MFVIVDVLRDEKCCLENVENVLGGSGCGVSLCVDVVLLNLIEKDMNGLWIVDALDGAW